MYAFLVALGVVVAAAGVLIAIPGLPFDGRDFDPSIITPGAVALVGGFILIGLGLAVRVLARIEKALGARPAPRPAVLDDPRTAAAAEQPSPVPARIPFPPPPNPVAQTRAESKPQPEPKPAAVTPALPEDMALQRLREQLPTLNRLDSAPVVEEIDVSLLPKPPVRVEEDVVEEGDNAIVQRQQPANGVPARTERQLKLHVSPAGRPERPRSFDAFWPKRPRPVRSAQSAPAVAVPPAAPAPLVEPVLSAEPTQFQFREAAAAPQPLAAAPEAPVPISVLKSGVVDGMAYTLYSDGSIEAQLPQGTLRFGSITELRNHIEQSA